MLDFVSNSTKLQTYTYYYLDSLIFCEFSIVLMQYKIYIYDRIALDPVLTHY